MQKEFNIIFIISFFLPLFYFALLISKKEKLLSEKILTFLILAMGLHLLNSYLKHEGYWNTYPHLVGITVPLPFVYGPLMYLYIYYSIHSSQGFDKTKLLHLIPFLVVTTYMCRFYFFYTPEEKRLLDAGEIHDFDMFTNIIIVVFAISVLYYVLQAFRLVIGYKKTLDNNFSNTKLMDIKWLRGVVIGFGVFFVVIIVWVILSELAGHQKAYDNNAFFNFLLLILFLFFGFYGIRNKNIFASTELVKDEKNGSLYKNSGLKEETANEKHKELLNYMEKEKPYLEPKLSLNILAQKLDISTNHLSQIINRYEKQNFNDFVNKYRVSEFINKASEKKHFNLLVLAHDSGFNSKSTFNSVFKKSKGKTPSQYLASLNYPD